MFWTDPTLYGATLPQRELPVTAPYIPPFYGQGLPMQNLPMQGLPMQGLPMQGLPMQGLPMQGLPTQGLPMQGLPTQGLPMQSIPWQNAQRFVPPIPMGYQGYQGYQGYPGYLGQPSFPQWFGHTPFAMNPYVSAFNPSYGYGFQKPFLF